ncbi:sigma-70 family RNA polymerase sigma factor [Acidiluteibacter ferrifornacis]|jgi:RNA polymerase primary sigma factor|uniref:Sigma-70 family RNA polymerase sigma factor n=1 Tax=Acidiluteibacter ferrifornacis TaxID=2692424 RepID=A0A6N9NMG6_9FLAO|nr:RNA polymerase sigma factor RpoD/SigA [Acidiluteibacter ferrifornacis]MBR9831260.1 RNA polymerase sigma factor RpoD/SigA [bacterium]NBG67084.1 sigma-70 family RNA polymerase sigma factor [Acidiluteibacter ferrifornacis]
MRQLKISQQITKRESKSLEKYLQDVSKEEMINAEEEVELAIKIQSGDERALNRLVRANLRFVISVAKQYQNTGLTLEDLINEGNLGLIEAAKRYDHTKGFKFISYAVWWIRQSILKAAADNSRTIRLPHNRLGEIQKISKASNEFEQKNERTPTADELSDLTEMDVAKVEMSLKMSKKQVSIDAPMSNDDDNNSLVSVLENSDTPDPTDSLMQESLSKDLERTLSYLKGMEAEVIRLFYGLGGSSEMTLEEIGNTFGLTRERIRQIKERGLRRLRRVSSQTNLQTYL